MAKTKSIQKAWLVKKRAGGKHKQQSVVLLPFTAKAAAKPNDKVCVTATLETGTVMEQAADQVLKAVILARLLCMTPF